MKKLLNFLALIIIVGFVGSWECGNCSFAELLRNTGNVLSVLMILQLTRIVFALFRHNIGKKNVINS